jgi:hypothetical protein
MITAEASPVRDIFERTEAGDKMWVIRNDSNARGVSRPSSRLADHRVAERMTSFRVRKPADVRLLPDAEARENPPQQIITGELTSDFVESLLSPAKLFSHELAGATLLELTLSFVNVAAGTGE